MANCEVPCQSDASQSPKSSPNPCQSDASQSSKSSPNPCQSGASQSSKSSPNPCQSDASQSSKSSPNPCQSDASQSSKSSPNPCQSDASQSSNSSPNPCQSDTSQSSKSSPNPCQSDTSQSPKSTPVHMLVMLPPCRICSERASGFHYGVNTCEACKGFFRRSLKKKTQYKCTYDGKCDTQSGKRNMCAACRHKKCIEVGMSKSAIKTGRYTHEKKTKNIKEVKQLEQAERAAIPREPSPDMMALLSKLPLQISENKYEKVIEHILAAYQEQTMHTVDFFSNIREKEETYLEERRLYAEMFGSLKPVTAEEYTKIYQSTGLDIDGRRELVEHMIPRIENGMRRCIAFVKALPGFQSLPMEDQMALIKISTKEMWPILYHKGFNHEHRIVTLFWGDTVDMETMCAIHGPENMEAVFKFTSRVKKLDLTYPETVLLAVLSIFFTDKCPLVCPTRVETIQELMTETLSYLLNQVQSSSPHRLAQCLLVLRELRNVSNVFRNMEDKFLTTWADKVDIPPLFREMWSPFT
ncbi:Nuclear hormone receptor E75 [Lamellibrachia satsuma]|nr:Nuclear hormone receptor E75 [Lamellibrachia satsuma]